MATDTTVTVILKGGGSVGVAATEAEAAAISKMFKKAMKDPAEKSMLDAAYGEGAGTLKLAAAELAGLMVAKA